MSLADSATARSTEVVVVRAMTPADAPFAAAVHEKALPHGFFGRLGVRFLTAYYTSFCASPHAVAFIAETTDGPAGALVGTVCNGSHYSWVLRNHGALLARRGVVALLARPAELAFFVRTRVGRYLAGLLRLGRRAVVNESRPPDRPGQKRSGAPAVLTHVAVADHARGHGVGAALVEAFVTSSRRAGCSHACLVTLADERGAGGFYGGLGWELEDVHTDRDGQALESYHRQL